MLAFEPVSNAEVKVDAEHRTGTPAFRFTSVPAPANNDAASQAKFTIVDGEGDPNGGELAVLHDGRLPTEADQPGASNGPAPTIATVTNREPILKSFTAAEGKYHFTIDATLAPDLMEWADTKLRPVVQEWYPKLVAMLPSEGFEARTNITLQFENDMDRIPASAAGGRINMNSGWFRRELKREAIGSVVHEMVHVVQSYGSARRNNPQAVRTPGWLVEGIPDYIRWFLYEPETKGAEITERNLAKAKYNASYRITGNFLNWVTQNYDRELVRKLNVAARQGKYSEQLWKDWTGKTVQELGDEWRRGHEERLAKGKSKTEGSDSNSK
jgi:hypothetical protein